MNDGKGFAIFRLSCIVRQLWLVHIRDGRGSYPEFYRTRECYSRAADALELLTGHAVSEGKLTGLMTL